VPSPFITLQYVLPHHLISRVVLVATRVKFSPVKNWMIGFFMRGYKPDLSDAVQEDPFAYPSFNAFFTRALKPSARPLAGTSRVLLSPVDGTLSQCGTIRGGKLVQAKGHQYSLDTLLAGAAIDWSARFRNGRFATIYLAPYNYHRIHMPATGTLEDAWYVPGRLFSVNQAAAAQIPNLFARNERVVLLFNGDCGPFAVIFIGALNVGSMATVWHGDVTPRQPRRITALPLPAPGQRTLQRGAEVGRFNMGSTVILLFARDAVSLSPALLAGQALRMGQEIGMMRSGAAGKGGDAA
jgi:phosphatidylserine decarboxylase